MRGTFYIYRASSDEHTDVLQMYTPNGNLELPIEVFDALVCMRYAQLEKEQDIKSLELDIAENYRGNFGVDALCSKVGIKTSEQEIEEAVKKTKQT